MFLDHLVIIGQSGWTQLLERPTSGLAHLPILAAPGVIEKLASGGQQLGTAAEQWIAETGAQGYGFLDRSDAAVRIDEAERTDEKAECGDASRSESGLGRPGGLGLVRAGTLDHRAVQGLGVGDGCNKVDVEARL